MYRDSETVELLGKEWNKSRRAGKGYLYRMSTNSGKEVTRDRLVSIAEDQNVGLSLGNGYAGELQYEDGEADVEILDNAIHIRSEDELEDLLEPGPELPFG